MGSCLSGVRWVDGVVVVCACIIIAYNNMYVTYSYASCVSVRLVPTHICVRIHITSITTLSLSPL